MKKVKAWALVKKGNLAYRGYASISIFGMKGAANDRNILDYNGRAKVVRVLITEISEKK